MGGNRPNDEDGSRRDLILSLLCDHCFHPDQQTRIAQPLYTISSLQRHLQMESFITWLQDWIDDPKFEQLTNSPPFSIKTFQKAPKRQWKDLNQPRV